MHYPISNIQVEFENNRLIRYQITRKEIVSTDDRRTYGQTSRLSTIDSFFKERKKLLKNYEMVVLYSVASAERGDHLKLQTVKTNILPPKNTLVTILQELPGM